MSDTEQPENSETDPGRRNFLKLGLAGAGAAAAAAGGVTVIRRMEGLPHEDFPLPVREDYKPIDQRNQINVFCNSKALNAKHPERNASFNAQLKKENVQSSKPFHFYDTRRMFMKGPYRDAPGYGQLERALAVAGFSSARQQLGGIGGDARENGLLDELNRTVKDSLSGCACPARGR
jgi:epoxyqueuosine reductase